MKAILKFFDGMWYPAVYAVLALISSLTGMEIAFYAITAVVVVFTTIFSRDTKPLIAPVLMAVYAVSWKHTPQTPYESDFFYDSGVQMYFLCLGVLLVACMLFRFVVFPQDRNFFKESKLRLGIILMTAALLLNGVGYSGYVIADLPFGLLIALSLFAFYIYFYNTLYVDKSMGTYVGYLCIMAAGIIFLQLCKVYIFDGVVVDGEINDKLIKAGWGMKNNVGGMLATFFPACFFIAYKRKKLGWIFYVLGFVFFVGVCLTQSRASTLVGGIILVAIAIYMCITKSPVRKFVWVFNAAVVIGCAIFAALRWDLVQLIFSAFTKRGWSDSSRFSIWRTGLKNFLLAPIFGVGFYEPVLPNGGSYNIENWVFPDMYHNTFVQLIACCGAFGIIAYLVHIVQVAFAVKKNPSAESLFFVVMLIGIFGMSLLDNHLFHVYPAMVYSVFLLLSEREGEDGPLLLLRPLVIRRRKGRADAEGATPSPEGAAPSAEGGTCNCSPAEPVQPARPQGDSGTNNAN